MGQCASCLQTAHERFLLALRSREASNRQSRRAYVETEGLLSDATLDSVLEEVDVG